jgi:hypothetical protein
MTHHTACESYQSKFRQASISKNVIRNDNNKV